MHRRGWRLSPGELLSSGQPGWGSAPPSSPRRGCVSPPFSWWARGPSCPRRPWQSLDSPWAQRSHREQPSYPAGTSPAWTQVCFLTRVGVAAAAGPWLLTFSVTSWRLWRSPAVGQCRATATAAEGQQIPLMSHGTMLSQLFKFLFLGLLLTMVHFTKEAPGTCWRNTRPNYQ